MQLIIPCETVARLSSIALAAKPEISDCFRTIRIENYLAIASNRKIMAIENIGGGFSGVFHLLIDQNLAEKCRIEGKFNSNLEIVINEPLKFASAKTTLGYEHVTNCGYFPTGQNDFNDWINAVKRNTKQINKSAGAMFWDADLIAQLAGSSPSGCIIFEKFIDVESERPALLRDLYDDKWCGFFMPWTNDQQYSPAKLPDWLPQ